MKKIMTMSTVLCFFISTGHAQLLYPEVYSSFGGDTQTSTFQLTWTGGEPLFETYVAEGSILTQGFNQTVQVIEEITFIEELDLDLSVYPNPASDYLVIQVNQEYKNDLSVRMVNIQGASSGIIKFNNSTAVIDVSGLSPGMYYLQVSDSDSNTMKTFKISIIK
jgi:hypothetical protein